MSNVPQMTVNDFAKLVTKSVYEVLNTGSHLRISNYNGDISFKANEFIEEFEERAKCKNWTDTHKFERFSSYLESTAKDWYRLSIKSTSPPTDWNALKKAFLDYFLPKNQKNHYREQMNKRTQGSREPVKNYIVSKLLKCVEFNDKMDDNEKMSSVFEGLIPEIKRELTIKDYESLKELTDGAQQVEQALKIMPNNSSVSAESDENQQLILEYMKNMNLRLDKLTEARNREEFIEEFDRNEPKYNMNLNTDYQRQEFNRLYNYNQNHFNRGFRSNNYRYNDYRFNPQNSTYSARPLNYNYNSPQYPYRIRNAQFQPYNYNANYNQSSNDYSSQNNPNRRDSLRTQNNTENNEQSRPQSPNASRTQPKEADKNAFKTTVPKHVSFDPNQAGISNQDRSCHW